MLTPEQRSLLQRHLSIDGDGNVVGNDNTVRVTKQAAGDYAVQIGEQRITVNIAELRRVLHIEHSQAGVIGDYAHVEGGIHITTYQHARPQPVDEAALAAAREQLAALPLDRVPSPATRPSPHRMPLCANPLFVGRERDLERLAEALKGQAVGATAPTAAIGQIAAATGMGGIGKTQLASEFVHRYGQYFAGGVFWLSFGDPQAVPAEIAGCGGPGALDLRPDFDALDLDAQVRLVLGAWCSPLPRLLVFDNCEDEGLLARWRPPTGGARLLVTSRRGTWSGALGVRSLRLDVLDRAESVALLRKHRPDLTDGEAGAIAGELGDLPLALHLAGSFLAAYRHASFGAPDAYLAHLREAALDHPSLAEEGRTLTTAHERHVGRTFALSYGRLDPEDPTGGLALALLARSAHFAPGEPIPRSLLLATLDRPAENDLEAERQAEDGLARLIALGLLDAEAGGRPVLHRLLAAFVRREAEGSGKAGESAQAAVERTLLTEARRLNNAGFPAPLLAWQPHLRHVTDAALGREDGPGGEGAERAAGLCNTLGYHLDMIGDYSGARPYYERALAIRERALGPDHPDTATSLNNLGALLNSMGDLAGARPYYERALAIRERALGPDHPDTARSLNNLAILCYYEDKLAEAARLMRRALAIWEAALGPDHPNTQSARQSLAAIEERLPEGA